MENKKLIKYLLNDLNELEELFTDREEMRFDELEIDFLNSRIKGVIKLVKILESRENGIERMKVEAKAEEKEKKVLLENCFIYFMLIFLY